MQTSQPVSLLCVSDIREKDEGMKPPAEVQTMDVSPHPLPSLQMIVEWSLVLIFVLVRTLNTNPTKTVREAVWIFLKESTSV